MAKPAAKPAKKAIAKKSAKPAAKADKVKRPPGPYMIFCKEERPKIVAKNKEMSFGEVGKALGAAWGKLSEAQKAKYKK